jgi:hypothetical protein
MKTYTYSEARQQFAALLDEARRTGRVQIRRRDGQLFVLQPATQERSPLDVPGVAAGLLAGESAAWLQEEPEAASERLLEGASGAPADPPRAKRAGSRARGS